MFHSFKVAPLLISRVMAGLVVTLCLLPSSLTFAYPVQGFTSVSGQLSVVGLPQSVDVLAWRYIFAPTTAVFGINAAASTSTLPDLSTDTMHIVDLAAEGNLLGTQHTATASVSGASAAANAYQTVNAVLAFTNTSAFDLSFSVIADVTVNLMSTDDFEGNGSATSFGEYILEVSDLTTNPSGDLLVSDTDSLFIDANGGAGAITDSLVYSRILAIDLAPGQTLAVGLTTSVITSAVVVPVPAAAWFFASGMLCLVPGINNGKWRKN